MDRIASSARPPRPSALTLGLFLVGAFGPTVPAVAQGTLEARIREGVFVVFDGDGQSLPGARSLVPIASVELPQSTGC